MCTVTFLPLNSGIILTTNRDEDIARAHVLAPKAYPRPGHINFYPADRQSGGTWFITNNMGDCGILLNGAGSNHQSNPPYKASRGKVLPAVFAISEPLTGLKTLNLPGYEPFTIILYAGSQLYKCLWDGTGLQIKKLDHAIPQIWSSVTLYDINARRAKMKSFTRWLNANKSPDWATVYKYHISAAIKNAGPAGNVQTLSVTSSVISQGNIQLFYNDLLLDTVTTNTVELLVPDTVTHML